MSKTSIEERGNHMKLNIGNTRQRLVASTTGDTTANRSCVRVRPIDAAILAVIILFCAGCASKAETSIRPPAQDLTKKTGAVSHEAPYTSLKDEDWRRWLRQQTTVDVESVAWSSDGKSLLVGTCPKNQAPTTKSIPCTLWNYDLTSQTFHSLPHLLSSDTWEYRDAVYTPDGQHIVAVEFGPSCNEELHGCGKGQISAMRLVLLSLDGHRERYLSGPGFWKMPSVTRDGRTVLVWHPGVLAGSQGVFPFYNVWQVPILSGGIGEARMVLKLFADWPSSPPRDWIDGRIMVSAFGGWRLNERSQPLYGKASYQDLHGSNYLLVLPPDENPPRIWPHFEDANTPPEKHVEGKGKSHGSVIPFDLSSDRRVLLYSTYEGFVLRRTDKPVGRGDLAFRSDYALAGAALSPDGERIAGRFSHGKYICLIDVKSGHTDFVIPSW